MSLTEYSPRQASLVVSIWIILEIRKLADNQNHSIIWLKWKYKNMLPKNRIDLTIFVSVSQASKSGRQFGNKGKILLYKETVLLRRWESET